MCSLIFTASNIEAISALVGVWELIMNEIKGARIAVFTQPQYLLAFKQNYH